MYDLNLLPLKIHEGQQEIASAGFTASAPPRRAARSRSEDMLILSLAFNGDGRAASGIEKDWLNSLIQAFFKTGGSVTSAMRSLIETINLTLMENNLKSGRDIGTTIGAINLAAIHRRILYIAQSGPTHTFVLNHQGLAHFYDASQTDRGLGLRRSPNIRYFQADIGQGSYFFTTSTPPETWTEELLFTGGFPTLEQLRRRLLNQAPSELRLDLVEIKAGEGQIILQQPQIQPKESESAGVLEDVTFENERPDTTAALDDKPIFETQKIHAEKEEKQDQAPDSEEEISTSEIDIKSQDTFLKDEEQKLDTSSLPAEEKPDKDQVEQQVVKTTPKRQAKARKGKEKVSRQKMIAGTEKIKARTFKGLAAFVSGWQSTREKISTFFKDIVSRWSPAGSDGTPRLSKGTLLLIAVVVPLVMVGIAAGVYFARGRNIQYQQYFEQAQLASTAALAAEDPNQSRQAWYQALDYLDQAETYRETEEITALRMQAQDALDALDGAVRLNYQPAIVGSLYSEINITNIISYGPDLYLLDSAGGRVIHARRASQGYEIDPDFVCAAGSYSGGRIEALVDMVSLPINNPYQAHILTVDAAGNLAYCAPGQNPVVQSLPSLGGNSNAVRGITQDVNYLYVLIPESSAIYVYRPTNGQFLDAPIDFFEDLEFADIPDLNQVVDLAVNGQDLYLLQRDGKLINCTTSSLAGNPVTCENPVDYIDGRPGKEEQIFTMPESNYSAILYTTPPDPSISILDSENADIYRFSLRFRLYDRLRPDMSDFEVESSAATAFTIGIDRVAFLAFGHQVFYAYVE